MTITLSHKILVTSALALACITPAMFAHAEEGTSNKEEMHTTKERSGKNASSTKDRDEKRASSTVNRTCMASAVTTREASLKTAWTTFSASVLSALDKRTTALVAAWNTESGRDGLKKAWSDWRTDKKAAHTKLRSDRKAAWDAFKKTAKDSCKVTTPKEEGLEKEAKDGINL